MATRALIYTRVSEDRAGGRSPREQEAECRLICEEEGWEVAEVVTDSKGASRHSKGTRTGWARVLDLLTSGEVDVLVAWESSRTGRSLDAFVDLRRLAVEHGVLLSFGGTTYDMTKSRDRKAAARDAVEAEGEADQTSERVRRAMRASAAQGRPPGRRLFGYERTYDPTTGRLFGQGPHPTEAEVVRDIFTAYIGGQGARTIARRLTAQGITTGTGAAWADTQVKRVLINPAYAARRVHRGEVVGDAGWPALVDAETFDRVQARLAAVAGRGTRQAPTSRLLTGVGRCGVCGGRVNALHDRRKRKSYGCRDRFCVGRDLAKLDAFVSEVVIQRLSRPDAAEALGWAEVDPVADAARQHADVLQAQLDDAVEQFTAGKLTGATLAKVEAGLLPHIEEAQRAVRRALVPIEVEVPSTDVAAWWEGLTAEVQREVVAALIASVVILPAKRGARTFDPNAVKIEWRR